MFWTASRLGDFELQATDGPIGAIRDCLIDDRAWKLRWFVVDTGTWLPGRRVLITPDRIEATGGETGGETGDVPPEIGVAISRAEVKASPPSDEKAGVSREYEEALVGHYGWQSYWTGLGHAPPPEGQPELCSADDLLGYHIVAEDGRIGHVDEILIDPDQWVVRYLVVDTRDWWPGKLVLLVPQAIAAIEAESRTVRVKLTREQIRNGPAFDPDQTIDRKIEEQFLGYYGYPVYW
jgi:hypothetical protein